MTWAHSHVQVLDTGCAYYHADYSRVLMVNVATCCCSFLVLHTSSSLRPHRLCTNYVRLHRIYSCNHWWNGLVHYTRKQDIERSYWNQSTRRSKDFLVSKFVRQRARARQATIHHRSVHSSQFISVRIVLFMLWSCQDDLSNLDVDNAFLDSLRLDMLRPCSSNALHHCCLPGHSIFLCRHVAAPKYRHWQARSHAACLQEHHTDVHGLLIRYDA